MSPRSLFIIILRVIGIFSIKELIVSFFEIIPYIYSLLGNSRTSDAVWLLIIQIFIVAIFSLVSYMLIFKAAYLVERFDLGSHLPSTLQLQLQTRDILRIALVVTACIVLFFQFPDFIKNLADMLEVERTLFRQPKNWSAVIIPGVKILLALLLIGERQRLLDILLKDGPNNPVDEPVQPNSEESKDLFDDHQER